MKINFSINERNILNFISNREIKCLCNIEQFRQVLDEIKNAIAISYIECLETTINLLCHTWDFCQ